jgi:hypothetical protein
LAKEDTLTVSLLSEERLNAQAVAAVKVARKGQPDVKLSFDKSSNL